MSRNSFCSLYQVTMLNFRNTILLMNLEESIYKVSLSNRKRRSIQSIEVLKVNLSLLLIKFLLTNSRKYHILMYPYEINSFVDIL
jgi:hypothetical protein